VFVVLTRRYRARYCGYSPLLCELTLQKARF
jgi:hypothetical protein